MKSSAYWQKRFEQIEQSQNQKGIQCYADIEKQYRQAQKQIEGQISAWYQRFATNNGVSLADAKRMLNVKELAELKWDINQYIQYGQENAINGSWCKQLENASARFHISRLEALKLQMQQSIEVMFGNQLDSIDAAMRDVYKSGYYHTAFEIQKGVGVGWDFATLDEKQISKVINKPWAADGKNFSERVWGNRQKLVNELNQTLTQNIILGKDPQKAIDAIAKKMNTSKTAAGRLVMTEEAFFSSAAQKDCFAELDVEQFEVVATLDSHTSEICQEMDGKHFPMSQWEVGVTAPPFHVWCRSTTVPYFDDEFDSVGERTARGEDGKTYYVPANMTYKQWQKSFVQGDKTGLQEATSDDTIKAKKEVKTISTYDEVKPTLKDTVGFDEVEDSFNLVEHSLAIDATNQLMKLEKKFGVVHRSSGSICSESLKNAEAYVSSTRTTPLNQSLSLCPKYFKNSSEHIRTLISQRDNNWSMPFADEYASVYDVTHEYGHMIQNMLIQDRQISKGWSADNAFQFYDRTKKTPKAMFRWYSNVRKEVQDECFTEIVAIATENNAEFSLVDNLSKYGRTNKAEFFAEVFANSQLGDENELGKAMNEWLKRKGLIQ